MTEVRSLGRVTFDKANACMRKRIARDLVRMRKRIDEEKDPKKREKLSQAYARLLSTIIEERQARSKEKNYLKAKLENIG